MIDVEIQDENKEKELKREELIYNIKNRKQELKKLEKQYNVS